MGLGNRSDRILRAALVALGLIASFPVWPGAAKAELQKVEAVGTYGIRERLRTKVIPRDEAVQNAIWEGVSRVAVDEIGQLPIPDPVESMESSSEPGDTGGENSTLRAALGKDMLPYTRSFRIVEDKGESPVLFAEDPTIQVEYIVVVEMLVDVARVRSALAKTGLIAAGSSSGNVGEPIFVEIVGLRRHRDFEEVRAAIVSEIGASRVDPLGFARGQQLLSVVGPFGISELSAALARLDGGAWALEPVGLDESRRRLRVRGRRVERFGEEFE